MQVCTIEGHLFVPSVSGRRAYLALECLKQYVLVVEALVVLEMRFLRFVAMEGTTGPTAAVFMSHFIHEFGL